MFRNPALAPWQAEGIDVSFTLSDTQWTFDVVLREPSGALVVAECRRTVDAVKQEDVAAFAYKVEGLRKSMDVPVAGFFITKTAHQIGAVRVGQFNGIELAVLEEGATPPGFNITFLRFDADREKKLRDIIMHETPGSYASTGMPVTLTHGKASGESESR